MTVKASLHHHHTTPQGAAQDPTYTIAVDNHAEWQEHILQAQVMAQVAEAAGELVPALISHGHRMRDCGRDLHGQYCPTCGKVHITRGTSCRLRLCPTCGWRLTAKLITQLRAELDALRIQQPGVRYVWLTVSPPNVGSADELRDTMLRMAEAWRRITRRKDIKAVLLGSLRKSEVRPSKDGRTYNAHFHALMAVKPEYFYGRSYIPADRWIEICRDAMQLEKAPSVKVAAVKAGPVTPMELGAYAVKPMAILDRRQGLQARAQCYADIAGALQGLRLYSWTGEWRKIRAQLKHGDPETMPLGEAEAPVCGVCGSALELAILRMAAQGGEIDYIRTETGEVIYRAAKPTLLHGGKE